MWKVVVKSIYISIWKNKFQIDKNWNKIKIIRKTKWILVRLRDMSEKNKKSKTHKRYRCFKIIKLLKVLKIIKWTIYQ